VDVVLLQLVNIGCYRKKKKLVHDSDENYMTVGKKQNWKTYHMKQHHVHSFAHCLEKLFSFQMPAICQGMA
jgi:hypothetical protein